MSCLWLHNTRYVIKYILTPQYLRVSPNHLEIARERSVLYLEILAELISGKPGKNHLIFSIICELHENNCSENIISASTIKDRNVEIAKENDTSYLLYVSATSQCFQSICNYNINIIFKTFNYISPEKR